MAGTTEAISVDELFPGDYGSYAYSLSSFRADLDTEFAAGNHPFARAAQARLRMRISEMRESSPTFFSRYVEDCLEQTGYADLTGSIGAAKQPATQEPAQAPLAFQRPSEVVLMYVTRDTTGTIG